MFSKNVVTLVRHLVKDGALAIDLEDEITKGTLVTRDGQVVHDAVKGKLG
jgi:NAD(P) transhydrogenase subunit alpha